MKMNHSFDKQDVEIMIQGKVDNCNICKFEYVTKWEIKNNDNVKACKKISPANYEPGWKVLFC